MYLRLTTLSVRSGLMAGALEALAPRVSGESLLGCWNSVLGDAPRIHVLSKAEEVSDHEELRKRAVAGWGLSPLASFIESVSSDIYATLPCLPEVPTGKFGTIYEIRSYELHPGGALEAACRGWDEVIAVRLGLAPITAVMHSIGGVVPRLVHIYPYRSLAHRDEIRDAAVATGLWPPKGGAGRNRVMRCEIAVPAAFSPIC